MDGAPPDTVKCADRCSIREYPYLPGIADFDFRAIDKHPLERFEGEGGGRGDSSVHADDVFDAIELGHKLPKRWGHPSASLAAEVFFKVDTCHGRHGGGLLAWGRTSRVTRAEHSRRRGGGRRAETRWHICAGRRRGILQTETY